MNKTQLIAALVSLFAFAGQAQAVDMKQTTFELYNADNTPVKVVLTLTASGSPNPGFVQNVTNLPWRHPVDMKLVTPGNYLQGTFKLRNGDTATLNLPKGSAISGKFTFDDVPGPNITEASITLDNNTAAFDPNATEFAGINCGTTVAPKINARVRFDLTPGWPSPSGTILGFEDNKKGAVTPVASVSRLATQSGGTVKLTFLKGIASQTP